MKRLDVLPSRNYAATINPCRLCAPLGASLAVRGVSGAMPVLHGSQGCATYIRRYLVSHFREPMDVASSSFGENEAIFGGASNLGLALDNVVERYRPELIAVATTCLAETIGDDVPGIVKRWVKEHGTNAPAVVHASTAAYSGSHAEGYDRTVFAMVDQLAEGGEPVEQVNLFMPIAATPADIRYLKELTAAFGLRIAAIPDISETLDGGSWEHYESIPPGGTSLAELRASGRAKASLTLGSELSGEESIGHRLNERFSVPNHVVGMPIGIEGSDRLVLALSEIAGVPAPVAVTRARARLVDAMVDGHKALFERRIGIVGDADFVVGLAAFCQEVGLIPVMCASGSNRGRMQKAVDGRLPPEAIVLDDSDHDRISDVAKELKLDLLIGPSKVRAWSRLLGVPLLHLGFPIHDRFGAARLQTFGYEGTLQLLDRVINCLLERRQNEAGLGWAYL